MGFLMQAQDAAYSVLGACLWELEAGTLCGFMTMILSGILLPFHLLGRKTKISTDLS